MHEEQNTKIPPAMHVTNIQMLHDDLSVTSLSNVLPIVQKIGNTI